MKKQKETATQDGARLRRDNTIEGIVKYTGHPCHPVVLTKRDTSRGGTPEHSVYCCGSWSRGVLAV